MKKLILLPKILCLITMVFLNLMFIMAENFL